MLRVLVLDDESAANRIRMVSVALERFESKLLGAFTVATETTIRIRRM